MNSFIKKLSPLFSYVIASLSAFVAVTSESLDEAIMLMICSGVWYACGLIEEKPND